MKFGKRCKRTLIITISMICLKTVKYIHTRTMLDASLHSWSKVLHVKVVFKAFQITENQRVYEEK